MATVIHLLKDYNYKDVSKAFAKAIADGSSDIHVDFAELDSINSELVGTLVMMKHTLTNVRGALTLFNVNGVIKETLELSGVPGLGIIIKECDNAH